LLGIGTTSVSVFLRVGYPAIGTGNHPPPVGVSAPSPTGTGSAMPQAFSRALDRLREWPLLAQRNGDPTARGPAARSRQTDELEPRTRRADRVVRSVCPYCAVGCGQRVFVEHGRITQIEGDPDSPISRGRLCPKGSASRSLVTSPLREQRVKYRPPRATEWQELDLETAMQMIADRVIDARRRTWEWEDEEGRMLRRSQGVVSLGGATLDNEENYCIKKLMTSLGFVIVENQARI
jgi:formate dehydrogenase major subunit